MSCRVRSESWWQKLLILSKDFWKTGLRMYRFLSSICLQCLVFLCLTHFFQVAKPFHSLYCLKTSSVMIWLYRLYSRSHWSRGVNSAWPSMKWVTPAELMV